MLHGEEVAQTSSPTQDIKASKFSLRVFRYGTTGDFVLIFISLVCNFASGLILPIFFRFFGGVLDTVALPGGTDMLFYVKLMMYLGAGAFVICAIGATTMEIAAERQVRELKAKFLESITVQEMGWFDAFDPGKVSSTLSQNASTIREGIGLKLAQMSMFLGMFIGGYVVGFWLNWKITLVITAGLPVMTAVSAYLMKMMSDADSVARKAYAKAASVVEETLLSIKTVAAYCLQPRAIQLFKDNLGDSYRAGIRTSLGIAMTFGCMFAVFFFIEALAFWYGGKLVADDMEKYGLRCYLDASEGGVSCVQGGEVLAVFFCVVIGAFAIAQAGPSLTALSKASSAMSELDDIIRRETQIHPNDTSRPDLNSGIVKGEVEFKRVRFSYPTRPDLAVFSNLNLKIEAGKTTALVGGSGCGKSTIIQLVERYYDINEGELLVDGVELREINLRSWRQRVALVSQEPKLFAVSIKENIRVGKLDATDEEIIQAAKQANAHAFIESFPNKYDTFVGQGGGQLSGGQKQRIAIARAILRDPTLLILDEATSALDNESEKIVQETLDKLLETTKRTTIVIAHRLTTIRNADRIVVLHNEGDGAEVAEEGTHDQLMALGGIYKALVDAQNLDANDEASEVAQDIAVDMADLPARSRSLLQLHSKFSRDMSKSSSKGSIDLSRINIQPEEIPVDKSNFMKVARFLIPYWHYVTIGMLGAVINGMVFPVYAILFSKILGSMYLPTHQMIRDDVSKWAWGLVGLGVGSFIGAGIQNGMFAWAGVKVIKELRAKLFASIVYQDQSFFDDPKFSLGTLTDMLAADTTLVKGYVGDNVGIYLQIGVCIIAAIIITFMANVKLAGVAMGVFFVLTPAALIEAQFTMPPAPDGSELKGDTEQAVESTAFILQETILNVRTVGAYTLEDEMNSKYLRIVDKDWLAGRKRAYIAGVAWGFSQAAQYFGQALLMWYGGKLVEDGEIGPDRMFRGIMALMMAAMSVGQTMMFATDINKAKAAAARVYAVHEREPKVDSRSRDKPDFPSLRSEVKFDRLKFIYPQRPDVPVYRNLSFEVKKGEVVALVGQSGCGKSTVVQLLERFYALGDESMEGPDASGSIKLDGVDIKTYNVPSIRERIGLVSQEPNLFTVSVRENIELGKYGQDVTWSEVEAAARAANAYNFIQEFPEGFDTNVGRLGEKLSGGQKQRVAIARAIIRDPEILILDEATSALDAESEEIVQAALDRLIEEGKRTTIVIAHRLSTVKKADKIVVLVNKKYGSVVAEVGTHNELLRKEDGVYRKLVEIAEGKKTVTA